MASDGIVLAYRRHETPSTLTIGFAAPAGRGAASAFTKDAWAEVCSRMGAAPYEHIAEEANAELPAADEPATEPAIEIAERRLASGGPPILRDSSYEYYYATFESLLPSQLDKDALLFHLHPTFVALRTHWYSAPHASYDWDIKGGTVCPPGGLGKVDATLVNATPASTVPLPRIGDIVSVHGQTICLLPLVWHRVDIELEYSEAVPVCFTFLDMASRHRLLTEEKKAEGLGNDHIVIGRCA